MLNYLKDLNDVQLQATKKVDGAVLVTAGAGSGKTRVLTRRISYLIDKFGVNPHNILAATFTNKAGQEMKKRIFDLVKHPDNSYIWIHTFHSFCVRFLRERRNIERIPGYSINFTIYDTNDRTRILKGLIAENKIDQEGFLDKVSWHISNCKNQNLSIMQYEQEINYLFDKETIIKLMNQYEQKMNNNNALDFDSLLTYTYSVLKNNPDILEYYQNKFKYIHIDEFQDTNKVQYDLARILSLKHQNIFVVGDEDQCIYTWRGANSSHMLKFIKDYEDVTTFKLEQNYRSTKKIIAAANQIISQNRNRLDKTLYTEKEDGVRIEHFAPSSENYEAEYVAEHIYNLTRSGKYSYKDVAVLMRLNALTRGFEEKLLNYNIPYRVFGGMKFYDRAEIKNILAYLKLIVNPKDSASFNRVINFPKRGIGKSALLNLRDYMSENDTPLNAILNLTEESKLSKGAKTKFLSFKALMNNLISKVDTMGIYDFLEYLLDMTGIMESYGSGKEEDVSRLYNINELLNSVKEYEKNNDNATLQDYLHTVSLTTDMDTYDEEQETVTLATVHGVKGLEFKVVFIVGLEDKIFPLKRQDSSDADMEEERRLMYVAITRAEERLYLTYAQSRFLYGKRAYSVPSVFLKDLGFIESTMSSSLNSIKPVTRSVNTTESVVQIKAVEQTAKPKLTNVKAGSKVSHPKFGVGIVLSVSGSANNQTVKVDFDGYGTKILALNFAPLSLV